MRAWKNGNIEVALSSGRNFPQSSHYSKEVKSILPQVIKRYADEEYAKAHALARRKKNCKTVRKIASKMAKEVPGDTRFKTLAANCGKTRVAAIEPRTRDTEPRARTRERPRPRPADSGASAAELANQTRVAWSQNNCSKAIRLGKKAYRAKSSRRVAYMIGTCACRIRRKRDARWAFRKLSGGLKAMVAKACQAKGISLP
jgi:hypothetical protein